MASPQIPSDCIEANKQFLTPDDAVELFSRLYDMPKATSVKQLDGYDAQNFLLDIDNVCMDNNRRNKDSTNSTSRYVLKIMSGEDSKEEALFRSVHSIQTYLKQHGFICAAPLQNIHGDDIKIEEFTRQQESDGPNAGKMLYGKFMIRAYPFLAGSNISQLIPANATQVFYELGKYLGKLHQLTENYPHDTSALKERAEKFEWSLDNLSGILKYVDVVKDTKCRDFIVDIIKTFESKVLARKQEFRQGIVHSDFSDTNTIVSPVLDAEGKPKNSSAAENTTYKVSGVVDFDDSQFNCLIYDVGISMMYMATAKCAGNHPLHASAAFLAGYQHVNPLTPAELEVLHVCQAARFAQSLVIGLYTYTYLQPGNKYLLLMQNSWPVIESLWEMEVDSLHKLWTDVAVECAKFESNAHCAH